MKKLILGTLVACTGTLGYSQMRSVEFESTIQAAEKKAQLTQGVTPSSSRAASSPITSAPGAVIFEETFGNGLNGDGSNGAWTTSGSPATALWEYRGTGTTPDNTTGSQGAYATNLGPITSNTTANGFMIFDSDWLDNAGTAGNFGNGVAAAPHSGYLESPVIDLSSYPNVVFELTSYYRRFSSECVIEFSTDGGSSWGAPIKLYGDNTAVFEVSVNNSTATGHQTSTYVTTGIGGNANVKFRLHFDGTDTSNPNGSGYYFWMVDDIRVVEAPHNDLSTSRIHWDFPVSATSDSAAYDYTWEVVPELQAPHDSAYVGMLITNLGSVTQENVKANVRVVGPTGSPLITSTSSISTLAVNATDSLAAGWAVLNQGVGNYSYEFFPTSDSTEDNGLNDTIKYAREVHPNNYTWSTDANIGYRTQSATSSYEICTYFEISVADKAATLSAEFNHNTNDPNDPDNLVPGSDFLAFRVIRADGFDANNAYTGADVAKYTTGGSSFYSVTTADLGNVITVPLTHDSGAGNDSLYPGAYYACVKTYNSNAFISSDQTKSDDAYRTGTTIVDVDDENDWGGFAVVPTIVLSMQNGVDPCAGTTITATFTEDETSQTNGSITASATGGSPAYTYNWLYPDGSTTGSGDQLTGLSQSGDYKLTVTDLFGCQSAELTHNLAGCVGLADLSVTSNVTPASGTGATDGAIDLSVSGGSNAPSFNWTGPNGFTSTQEDINGLATGTYNVTISDAQCAALTTDEQIIINVTSVNEINFASSVKVYPVPSAGTFTVDVENATEAMELTVRNVVGQAIYKRQLTSGSIQAVVDLGAPAAGIFFIDLKSESGEIATYKMIVE